MVRLKEEMTADATVVDVRFQFQNGAIKRSYNGRDQLIKWKFQFQNGAIKSWSR